MTLKLILKDLIGIFCTIMNNGNSDPGNNNYTNNNKNNSTESYLLYNG